MTPEIQTMKDAYLAGTVVPEIDIALAAYTVVNEYRWRAMPMPPRKVLEYNKLPADVRSKMTNSPANYMAYWGDAEVDRYYDTLRWTDMTNGTNLNWLKWMKQMLQPEHPDKAAECDRLLKGFVDQKETGIAQPDWGN